MSSIAVVTSQSNFVRARADAKPELTGRQLAKESLFGLIVSGSLWRGVIARGANRGSWVDRFCSRTG
jgi:hypothetical protein